MVGTASQGGSWGVRCTRLLAKGHTMRLATIVFFGRGGVVDMTVGIVMLVGVLWLLVAIARN